MSAPPCADDPRLFDSVFIGDHMQAADICVTCPLFEWCGNYAMEVQAEFRQLYRAGIHGTWAGTLYGSSINQPKRVAYEERMFTDADAKAAHAAYIRGDRDETTKAGERTFHRRAARNRKASVA